MSKWIRLYSDEDFTSGLAAALPASGTAVGARYYATDTQVWYSWNGTTWDQEGGGGTGTVDTFGTPVATDYARFTDADTIEGRSPAEVRADLDLEVGTDVAAQSHVGSTDGHPVAVGGGPGTETAGLMSGADKTKLDGVEPGAVAAGAAGDAHAAIVTGNPHALDAADVGADPAGTAATAVSGHEALSPAHAASSVSYDPTGTPLVSTNVQNALTELPIFRDLFANRGSYAVSGRFFYATDTLTLYYYTGSVWQQVSVGTLAGLGPGTLTNLDDIVIDADFDGSSVGDIVVTVDAGDNTPTLPAAILANLPSGGGGGPNYAFQVTQTTDGTTSPGTGLFSVTAGSSSTPSGITSFRINVTDANGVDQSDFLATIAPGTFFRVWDNADSSRWWVYRVTSQFSQSTYQRVDVVHVGDVAGDDTIDFDQSGTYNFHVYSATGTGQLITASKDYTFAPANSNFHSFDASNGLAIANDLGSAVAATAIAATTPETIGVTAPTGGTIVSLNVYGYASSDSATLEFRGINITPGTPGTAADLFTTLGSSLSFSTAGGTAGQMNCVNNLDLPQDNQVAFVVRRTSGTGAVRFTVTYRIIT